MAPAPLRRLIRKGPKAIAPGIALAFVLILALLALFATIYPIAGWIGSSIPRNGDFVEAGAETGVTIMVETNGTHAGIVVPVVTPLKDWRDTFPSAARPRLEDGRYPTHLGIGWGEREVFLTVATWDDLKASNVLRIMTSGGDAVVRVSHYIRPRPSENYRPVTISAQQYAQLVQQIEAAMPPLAPGEFHTVLRGTYSPDAYYEAVGTYTLRQTCNTWVGDTLAAAGIKMGAWTPFAGGVTKWIEPPVEETS